MRSLSDRSNKPKAFYFHYNKQQSRAAGKNILTVHYMKQCILVEEIDCQVPVKTKSRKKATSLRYAGQRYC